MHHRLASAAEVDLLHLPVARDLFGIALDQHHAVGHGRDAIGEFEHAIDVVFDQKNAHVPRQGPNHAHDALALGRGESGERFIQQQQPGSRRESQTDLHQSLSAVGEAGYLGAFDAFKSEKPDQRVGFGIHAVQFFLGPPGIETLGRVRLHSQAQILEHAQALE